MAKKRVACLYRVSTKKQTKLEDDIPMQRNACMEFIEKREDWELFHEYVEPGISGYHKGLKERPVLQQMISDVEEEKFDVFLVFMFDRLGRKDDETPFLLKRIVETGIEVWSVCEGQQKFENASDDLMNIIRFWGASNESKKTAARVDSGRNYGTKQGRFTGGIVPYGYCLRQTGKLDKKGRMINEFVKEPFESSVVEDIYSKLIDDNLTLNGIITYLNIDRQLKTRNGNQWCTTTVRNILRNPIYKGYMSYGKTRMFKVHQKDKDSSAWLMETSRRQRGVSPDQWILAEKRNDDYVVVSEERWQMAQDILTRRNKKYQENLRNNKDHTWKSTLLLSGLLECGYCHGMISPAVSSQKKILKDGKESRCYTEYYKCNTRGRGKDLCNAKSYISRRKLEEAVLTEVNSFLDRVEEVDCAVEIEKMSEETSKTEMVDLSRKKVELEKLEKGIVALHEEILKSVMGESELSKKDINDALISAEERKEALSLEITRKEEAIQARKIAQEQFEETVKTVPVWREVFEKAPLNVKKRLLSVLIEKIVVTNNTIDIHFKMDINSFLQIKGDNTGRKVQRANELQMDNKVIETEVHIEDFRG